VLPVNPSTTIPDFYGGLDAQLFVETKSIRYQTEKSWISKEYAIFEECFDASPKVLESLKYTLTSGNFITPDGQVHPLKTRMVIICTNVSKQEFLMKYGNSRSIAALLERFPYEHEVGWLSHKATDYALLLEKVVARNLEAGNHEFMAINTNTVNILSIIIENLNNAVENRQDKRNISPRIAIQMLSSLIGGIAMKKVGLLDNTFKVLSNFGHDEHIIAMVLREAEDKIKIFEMEQDFDSTIATYRTPSAIPPMEGFDPMHINSLLAYRYYYSTVEEAISTIYTPESRVSAKNAVLNIYKQAQADIEAKIAEVRSKKQQENQEFISALAQELIKLHKK
jgi:hypothetical protein